MPDTPAATPVPAAPAPAPTPQPVPAKPPAEPATGENLIPVSGTRPVIDPGDASPLGHPEGATPALVPPGAIDERAIN